MSIPDLKTRAELLHKGCTPDPYCDSLRQANEVAERNRRFLHELVQAACPPGVRFGGVQSIPGRHVYVFNVEEHSGTSFSIRPEYLSEERIAAEHQATLARMAREARALGGMGE